MEKLNKIIKNILNNNNIFYYISIIIIILFLVKQLNINISYIFLLILIIILFIIYYSYNLDKQYIIPNIDSYKYNKILDIYEKIFLIKDYNEYAFDESIINLKLFLNEQNTLQKKEYKAQILNNLQSIIISLPIQLDKYFYKYLNMLNNELEKYINTDTINQSDIYNNIYFNNEMYNSFNIY